MEQDNLTHLERFKKSPPHPSYISGLIDGDGCIFIRKIANGYQSGITIAQSRTNVLQVIRFHFGGSITTSENRNNKVEDKMNDSDDFYHKHNVRNQYNLQIRSNEYTILLEYIRHSIIIKQSQLECLNEFYKLVDIPNIVEQKEELYKKCSEINRNKTINEIHTERINIEYIQGLFDAEGCLYIDKNKSYKFKIGLAQKNHPIVLEKIKEFLGFGNVYKEDFIIHRKTDCLKFISLMKTGLIVKYNQAVAFETYLLTDDINIKQDMYRICNEEKHKIEQFNDVNCNSGGKEAFIETLRLREIKDTVCKEIRRKEVYREKSEKMMGEGNHNFGKPKTEEIKKKMSKSIRESKNGVSDDVILQVRKLIKEGKMNKEIQELLELPRHTVSRIKNGLLICRTECKTNEDKPLTKKPLTKEEQNIKKRKIQLDEIFIVIDKTVAGDKPMAILTLLDDLRVKRQIVNNLTIDIIKNIRRDICQHGSVPFYESEVNEEKYKYYKELIYNIRVYDTI
jgi:hypothetical protein